jgi:hypothetical protein
MRAEIRACLGTPVASHEAGGMGRDEMMIFPWRRFKVRLCIIGQFSISSGTDFTTILSIDGHDTRPRWQVRPVVGPPAQWLVIGRLVPEARMLDGCEERLVIRGKRGTADLGAERTR